MSLPRAADDAAPTLRNEHGLYAVRKEAIGKTATPRRSDCMRRLISWMTQELKWLGDLDSNQD